MGARKDPRKARRGGPARKKKAAGGGARGGPKGARRARPKPGRTRVAQVDEPAAGLFAEVVARARAAAPAGAGFVRLNAYLARCGVASRRGADRLIEAGRVEVDGETVTELGRRIDPLRSQVRVDGERLRPEKPVYVVLNKPKGVVCTNADREKRPRAIDLCSGVKGRIFPVGRLDADSEGLLLLTNDGEFALRMTHPRHGVPKLYSLVLRGRVENEILVRARKGVWLAEGKTQGLAVRVRRRTKERTYVEVRLREGRNRELRRIFARLGHPVLKLKRVRIGPLSIRGLGRGRWRFLKPAEVRALLASAAPEGA